ncbi:hypothetical protein UT300019_06890 [Clostridium sp. CTA-19]
MDKNILYKYVCIVDYEKPNIENRTVTDDLNGYILKLHDIIEDSDKVQFFKEKDLTTQVLSNVLSIVKKLHNDNTEGISVIMDSISNRLREKEEEAQKKIRHMGVEVKKGSLLQAIFKDSSYKEYEYLISKAEHNKYMGEKNYSIEEGFKVDEKNLWKSCLISCIIENDEVKVSEIRVYLDNTAKYWTENFLELNELRDDQQNTQQFFREIERVLKKDVYKFSKGDYSVLRNAIIEHIRTTDQIDYPAIIKSKFEKYKYEEDGLNEKQRFKLIQDLKELPSRETFDTQFTPDPSALSVRMIKESYKLTNDIELIVKDMNSDDKIVAFEDEIGKKYVQIETDNKDVFERYNKDKK